MFQRPGTKYYLSRAVPLLAFPGGRSSFDKFVAKDDCIVLIPVAMNGSVQATVHDPKTKQETAFTFQTGVVYIITGRCSIRLPEGSKVACAGLAIKREKG
jgi:hypothetical protein